VFSFEITSGPNAGLRCGGWRVWTRKEDTYITTAELGPKWKASLHGDVAWQVAITRENAASPDRLLPVGHDRAPWKFTPPPFIDGRRLAFAIAVSRGALRPDPPVEGDEHTIIAEDRWDLVTVAQVWMTEPGAALGIEPSLGPLALASGRQVWVAGAWEEVEPMDPEPVPVSAMIEPMWPEKHGVTAPGYMVRGVHLG